MIQLFGSALWPETLGNSLPSEAFVLSNLVLHDRLSDRCRRGYRPGAPHHRYSNRPHSWDSDRIRRIRMNRTLCD